LRIVRGFLDNNDALDPRVLSGIEDLAKVARAEFIDEIIVPLPLQREHVRTVVLEALRNHLDIRLVPELFEPYTSDLSIAVPVLPLHEEPIPEFGLLVKRALDVVLATLGLFAILPLLISISILIRIDSPGPVLYRAARVGKKGRRFLCWKFRTMVRDADASKAPLRERNERTGPLFKVKNDPRITRVGGMLRRYSLDELPQLWNVIRGEMSLVGPRPHPVDDYQRYGLQHLRRLDVTPGITGLWQVRARRDPSFYRNMQCDLEYIERWSLWLDVKILVQTLGAVLMGTGA
jgi:exopolysaccharide biosynthesis polyprenyl glycosylphosphotransferase